MKSSRLPAFLATLFLVAAQEPEDLFDPAKTSMDRAAAAAVGADLVEYAQARAKAAADYHIVGDFRKLVRVAYQLASDQGPVAAAHARIRNGLAPEGPKREVSRDDLMKALVALVTKSREGKAPHDVAAARYLCEVGQLIDPRNEACLVEWNKLSQRGGGISWEAALAVYRRAIPDGTTCSINGLAVTSAGGSARVGHVSRVVLIFRAGRFPTLDVTLLREESHQTKVSAEEAIRYWDRIRKHVPLPGGSLEISFEDKFSKKDGPSAGAAYAVLLRSFSDPFKVDPQFAMTGDVSVEGRILAVGGVYEKIRGAVMGGCARVGIPMGDEGELTDGLVLYGPMTLAEIEIHGLESVDDAIAVARADRDERLGQASAAFARLRPLVEKKLKANDSATSAEIQKLTDAVLAAAPRHLSARLIDAWNNRRLPTQLSLGTSLNEAHHVFISYLSAIRGKDELSFEDIADETKTTNINETLRKLRDVTPKLHADAAKPAAKLEATCLTIQRFIQARSGLDSREKQIKAIEKTIQELKEKIDKAKSAGRPADEINRLVKRHNATVEDHNQELARYKKAAEERGKIYDKVIETYNEYIVILRTLTQDPKLLEKLHHGK